MRFLTVLEAADLARLSPYRIRELMRSGILREGYEYFRPKGSRPRFDREALEKWLRGVPYRRRRPRAASLAEEFCHGNAQRE